MHETDQKTGQHFFISIEGYNLSKKTKHFLKTIQPGGIVFFKNNIKTKRQVKKLIREIKKCIKIRPFIAVDQEGGRVQRLRKICTFVPSPWALHAKPLLKYQQIIIRELSELGFNMNFAPVLDINSNPKNPIIGQRAISNKPEIVSKYGEKIIKLYAKNGILACVKHFPGHGGLSIDSHLDLPVLKKTKKELYNFELIPFKNAIKNKVPTMMIGHIEIPSIEKRPASISKEVLQNLLRKELKYGGLIITDDLLMKAIAKNYALKEASREAILAGANLILINTKEENILRVFEYIKKEATRNIKLRKMINKSYKKIVGIKKKYL